MTTSRFALAATLCLALFLCLTAPAWAQNARQGVIYAPLYQEAVIDHRGRRLDLAATVYVRNLSRKHPLTIEAVTLVDGKGGVGPQCLKQAQSLAPLATLRLPSPRCPKGLGRAQPVGALVRLPAGAAAFGGGAHDGHRRTAGHQPDQPGGCPWNRSHEPGAAQGKGPRLFRCHRPDRRAGDPGRPDPVFPQHPGRDPAPRPPQDPRRDNQGPETGRARPGPGDLFPGG